MSRQGQGNNYDNKYYKNAPYGSGNKGPGGNANGNFGGNQGGRSGNGNGGQNMGPAGNSGPNMNWGMYGGAYGGNRHSGGNRGFNSSQGPPGYNSSGGGQFGNNVRGSANSRGGGYNRHGEKGADYFVQDEVVGSGTGTPSYSPRKAPPAHSGAPPAHTASQYPNYPMFGHNAPPQAHGGMYGAYQGGFGGGTGPGNYSDYIGQFPNWPGDRFQPRGGYGGENRKSSEREERNQENPTIAQLPKSLSVTRFQKQDAEAKDARDSNQDSPDVDEDAPEAPKQPITGAGLGAERAGPPTSPGVPSSLGGGNRRKQSTPQKVPTSPGSATLIITQKGLSPPETDSPQHETPFISPKVFQTSKQGSSVGKVGSSDKSPEKLPAKPASSPAKPFSSPPKPVLKLSIPERSSDESDALVIDTGSPGTSKVITPSSSKLLKSPEKLLLMENKGDGLESSKKEKVVLARQSTEGDLADKEDVSDDDIKTKSIVRKKRLGKTDGAKKLDESDSEAESSGKTQRSPRNENKNDIPNDDSIKRKKTSRSPKAAEIREASKQEKGFVVPQVKELKEADLTSIRRRRSKGEMKEFPCDVNPISEESSPLKPHVENTDNSSSSEKKLEVGGSRRRRLSSGTQATKTKIYQQVEEDLEAMFAGLEDSDSEKRTKKKNTSSESASDEPKERKKPGPKPKQKDESAATSEVKPSSERKRPGPKPRYNMDPDKIEENEKKEKDEYSFDPEQFDSTPKQKKEKSDPKSSSDLEELLASPKPKPERKKPGPKPGFKRARKEQTEKGEGEEVLKETPPKPERKKPGPKPGSKREKRTVKNTYAELDDSIFEESSLHSPEKSKKSIEAKDEENQEKTSTTDKSSEEKPIVNFNSESTVELGEKGEGEEVLKETPPKPERKKPGPKPGSKREKRTVKNTYAELDDSVFEESSLHSPEKSKKSIEAKDEENQEKTSTTDKSSEEKPIVNLISESTVELDLKKSDADSLESNKKRGSDRKAKTNDEIIETDSPTTPKRSVSRIKTEAKPEQSPDKTRPRRRRSDIVESPVSATVVESLKDGEDGEKRGDNSRLAVRTGGKSKRISSTKSPIAKPVIKDDDIVSPKANKEEILPSKLVAEISDTEIIKNDVKLIKILSPTARMETSSATDVKEIRSSGRKRKASTLNNLESLNDSNEEKNDDVLKARKRMPHHSGSSSSTSEKKPLPPLEQPHRTSRRARGLPVDPKDIKANETEPGTLVDNITKILEPTIQLQVPEMPKNDSKSNTNVERSNDEIIKVVKNKEDSIENNDEDIIEVIKEIPFGGFLEKAKSPSNKFENVMKIMEEVPLATTNIKIAPLKETIEPPSKPQQDSSEKEKDVIESPKNPFALALIHSTLEDSFNSEDSPGKSPGKKRGRPFGSKNRSKDEKDFESDKDKRKTIKKDKNSTKVTDMDKENGSTSKPSSAKTSRRASVEESSKVKGGKKKIKKQNEVEMLLEKFKGPFIHINGDFNSPLNVRVINSASDSLDSSNKPSKVRAICDKEQRAKVSNFGHASTLSRQYDHKNLDDSWVCVFCNQTTHWKGLGDLFGPYWIPSNLIKTPQKKRPEAELVKSSSVESAKKNKRRRKSSLTEEKVNGSCAGTATATEDTSDVSEIWFHEDCLCWVPCTYLVGSKIVGLEEAVDQTSETVCGCCDNRGASVGCCSPGCRQTAHVSCAQRDGWTLNIDTFIATCKLHM